MSIANADLVNPAAGSGKKVPAWLYTFNAIAIFLLFLLIFSQELKMTWEIPRSERRITETKKAMDELAASDGKTSDLSIPWLTTLTIKSRWELFALDLALLAGAAAVALRTRPVWNYMRAMTTLLLVAMQLWIWTIYALVLLPSLRLMPPEGETFFVSAMSLSVPASSLFMLAAYFGSLYWGRHRGKAA